MALFKIATTQKGVGLFGKIKTDTSSSAGLMEYSKSIGITPKTPTPR